MQKKYLFFDNDVYNQYNRIQMNREARVKRPNQVQIRQRYGVCYQSFIGGQFNYSSHMLLRRICEAGSKEPNMYNVPLYKIMLQVAKIMMMNELQILFFGSTLQEMHWKITDPCLNDYFQDATDVTPKVQKDPQSLKVQLSLLLIAYIVKIYLNQENSLVDFKIRDIIKINFDRMYQTWVQKVQNNFKFNPKNMNKLFKDFDNNKKIKKFQIVDYNKLIAEFFKTNDGNLHEEKPEQIEGTFHYGKEPQQEDDLPIEYEEYPQTYQHKPTMNRMLSGPRLTLTRIESGGNQFFNSDSNDKRKQRQRFELIRGQSIDE